MRLASREEQGILIGIDLPLDQVSHKFDRQMSGATSMSGFMQTSQEQYGPQVPLGSAGIAKYELYFSYK